jgi:predicted ester cyclase
MGIRNKDVVRHVEEAWGTNDLDALDQYFAPDFDNSQSAMPGVPAGLEGAKMAHAMSMFSFPDRRTEIVDLIAEGDTVVVRIRMTGTNQGGFPAFAVAANGNPVDIQYVGIYRLRDGKIVQHWGLNDVMSLLMQLGAIPVPV